ncbi:MAG: hypothetical protein QM762_14885 [Chryseolinea sp.]
MARILKIKIAIGTISFLAIVFLWVVNTAGFAKVVYKQWGPLKWDDFDGYKPAFTSYDAAVSSYISLNFDSIRSKYVARALQINTRSWVKRDTSEQSALLRHEQYHFNITEIFARRLNQYIDQTPDGNLRVFELRLESLEIDLRMMQHDYDYETAHSTLVDKQRHWEFRIDSLLSLEKGWVTDQYSGGQAYFPSRPDSSKAVTGHAVYRRYSLVKYGVFLSLISFQNSELTQELLKEKLRDQVVNHLGGAINVDSSGNAYGDVKIDSGSHRTRYVFVGRAPILYHLQARYSLDMGDTTGYAKIVSSFINSFRIANTDEYWKTHFEDNIPSEAEVFNTTTQSQATDDNETIILKSQPVQGFFHTPIVTRKGSLIIPYDFVTHIDSLHSYDAAYLNDRLVVFNVQPHGQVFWIPAGKVPETDFYIGLGYELKEDSTREAKRLYLQHIKISQAELQRSRTF